MVLTNNRIQVKFFLGCLLTTDIQLKLNQSLDWKQSRISSQDNGCCLSEAFFQEKKYLGFFLEQPTVTLTELKNLEHKIRETLVKYCTDLSVDNLNIVVFSQIFIT